MTDLRHSMFSFDVLGIAVASHIYIRLLCQIGASKPKFLPNSPSPDTMVLCFAMTFYEFLL
jgi:hypothetical protein